MAAEAGFKIVVAMGGAAADLEFAEFLPGPILKLEHRQLLRRHEGGDGQVAARAESHEIGDLDRVAERVGLHVVRRQKAAAPLHGRIGVAEERQEADRDAQHLEGRVLVEDLPLLLVLNDAARPDPPQRRRLVLANGAGAVDRFGERRVFAVDAAALDGGDPRLAVAQHRAGAFDQAVLQGAVEGDLVGGDHRAVRVDQLDVAGGVDFVAHAVIGDLVGPKHAVAVEYADVAGGRDNLRIGVVFDPIRLKRREFFALRRAAETLTNLLGERGLAAFKRVRGLSRGGGGEIEDDGGGQRRRGAGCGPQPDFGFLAEKLHRRHAIGTPPQFSRRDATPVWSPAAADGLRRFPLEGVDDPHRSTSVSVASAVQSLRRSPATRRSEVEPTPQPL